MKKVWIFQTGEPIHIDKNNMRPMRAINLADYLIQNNCCVTLWSSNFIIKKYIGFQILNQLKLTLY